MLLACESSHESNRGERRLKRRVGMIDKVSGGFSLYEI